MILKVKLTPLKEVHVHPVICHFSKLKNESSAVIAKLCKHTLNVIFDKEMLCSLPFHCVVKALKVQHIYCFDL